MPEGLYNSPTIADERKLSPKELWATEIEYAEKELNKFHERGEKVNRRYIDERDAIEASQKWFNLFYANTKILRAALYAQIPVPEVKRRFEDYNDDVARVAASIIQRCISPDHDDPRDLFDATMRGCVFDRLVPGLAVAWLRLETDTEDVPVEPYAPVPENSGFEKSNAPDSPPTTYKKITDQRVCVDYVYWKDFIWSPCRVWAERRWVGRIVYLSREDLVKRFGEAKGNAVPLNYRPNGMTHYDKSSPSNIAIQRAKIYEIWDRMHRKIIWFCKDYDDLLDTKDDFLSLVGFEPCPTPMLANVTTSNTVPRPDYYIIQDQYSELDTTNQRIALLVKAVKAVGVYDKSADGIQRMFQEATDNQLIPVDNWAMFAEKGGIKGQVDWMPLDAISNALQRLYESREATKAQIYELTGIADIVRGASKASETLGAQEIKAKFASVRIKDVQDEAARFASDILRLKAEIMVKHFDPEILRRKSNIMHTDDVQYADAALELLKSEEGFEWRISVTTDQLAQTDYNLEKQDRIELLTSMSKYLQVAGPMYEANPQIGPLLVGLMKWAVAGFKGARDIESMLDRSLDNLLKQPEQPKPNPEQMKAEAEKQKVMMEEQRENRKSALEQQGRQAELQFSAAKHQQEMQHEQQSQALDIAGKRQDMVFEAQKNIMELRSGAQKHQQDMAQLIQKGEIQVAQAKAQAKAKPQQNGARK